MRICLIARNRFHSDRKAVATFRALTKAGHEVVVVAVDNAPPADPVVATMTGRVWLSNPILRRANRLLPARVASRILSRRMKLAASDLHADIYLPLHEDVLDVAVEAARAGGGVVQRAPGMKRAVPVDLIDLAPSHPDLAQPVHGVGPSFTPAATTVPHEPDAERYSGEKVVICYRKTGANPGRYLESALRRAGFDVRLETDALDLGTVDPATRFIVFVEGPYPAIDVTGTTKVPTLYWVHHGEHHLFPNLRLADRYRADAVLLAHSWHLAPWFPTPVHRFPFAVAAELFSQPKPLAQRRFDVAMVGSKLRGDAWQYRRRTELIAVIQSKLPAERIRFLEGVSPEEMADLYGDSRIVLNEGGIRHYPITMRVFEAIGAGAVLLTDSAPGLDLLFEPGREFAVIGDDVVADVDRLLRDLEASQALAERALARARAFHTYDHRVDLLVETARKTPKRQVVPSAAESDLARMIDADADVQRIVHDGVPGLDEQLPNREVWPLSERSGRLPAGSMDAAIITADEVAGMEPLLYSARRYIYSVGDVDGLDQYLASMYPNAVTHQNGDVRRIDLMTEAYRVSSAVSPR
ncbi:MAG TPA: glycosyltransferase [Acidimicrobiia bacterium]